MEVISVSSGYGYNTGQPFVEMVMGSEALKMSPGDARALATNLLCAAEAAMSDQFIFTFFSDQLEADVDMSGAMLGAFRDWRQGRDYVPGHEVEDEG